MSFDKKVVSEYLKQGNTLLTSGTVKEMKEFYNKSVSEIPIDYCMNCEHDNLGTCYLNEQDKFRVCFGNWLKNLEQL